MAFPGISLREICRVPNFPAPAGVRGNHEGIAGAGPIPAERIQRLIEPYPVFVYRRLWHAMVGPRQLPQSRRRI
jgi:hypothetical protein